MFAVAQAAEQALTSPHWLPTGNEGPNSGAAAAPPARLMLARARISAAWSSASPLLPVPSSCSAAAMQVVREAVEGLMWCSAWARLGPGRAPSRPLLREKSMALRAMHACKVTRRWGKIGWCGLCAISHVAAVESQWHCIQRDAGGTWRWRPLMEMPLQCVARARCCWPLFLPFF